jgi:transposase-like protein
MRYTPPTFTDLKDMAAIDAARLTEDEARTILENIRWPNGPVCPHCGSDNATRLEAKSQKFRDGLLQCNACRQQFTVTVGTVMHRSHITLRQWVQAFHSMCSHKKGVSALQLQRNLGLKSYKSAWHLAHRVRFAMRVMPLRAALQGTVEVDETYIGGKSRLGRRGRGSERKTPVVALVERGGRIRTRPVERVSAKALKSAIRQNVRKDARIMTDDFSSYHGLEREFTGGHEIVNHGEREYVRGDVHVNSAESFFALLKRGVHGTFHHVSKQHLHRYCDEFGFRWDHRKVTDGERTVAAIMGSEGKRLTYKKPVGNA